MASDADPRTQQSLTSLCSDLECRESTNITIVESTNTTIVEMLCWRPNIIEGSIAHHNVLS